MSSTTLAITNPTDITFKMDEESGIWAINILLVLIIIYTVWYIIRYATIRSWECSTMNSLYDKPNGSIQSVSSISPASNMALRDCYVKTAYNCCSGGAYKNDYVDLCNLKAVIRSGARCLDFEVYSIGDQPVVSTSALHNNCAKETFNSIPFASVMDVLSHAAFGSLKECPNPQDPLIIHLRAKSENVKMFNNFAKMLEKYDNILLGKRYSFESHGKNLGETPIKDLSGKIAIIVDRTNSAFLESTKFTEYVNLTSNSIFMRALHYNDIKYAPDITELTRFNRAQMTIGMPDRGPNPDNPSGMLLRETGCQFLGMGYQITGAHLDEMHAFFDQAGYAFVMKPEKLRYHRRTIPMPEKQNKNLSYATRDVDGGYYQFKI